MWAVPSPSPLELVARWASRDRTAESSEREPPIAVGIYALDCSLKCGLLTRIDNYLEAHLEVGRTRYWRAFPSRPLCSRYPYSAMETALSQFVRLVRLWEPN